MGLHLLTTWVSPSYMAMYDAALEKHVEMGRHDDLFTLDRVIIRLLELYAAPDTYQRRYRAKGVVRNYSLINFLPLFVDEHHGGEQLKLEIVGFRGDTRRPPGFNQDTVLSILSAVRHELAADGHSIPRLSLKDDAQMLAAATCFVAAERTRQWKEPFGTKLLPIVRD